jgi:hypothetical protein
MDLEKEVTRLADIEAIKQLKYTYADICDDDHNQARINGVFTDDGIWEDPTGMFGRGENADGINKLFGEFKALINFSQHNMFNPIIIVNGNTATGSWDLTGPFRLRENNEAYWCAGMYKDDYVKINGEWKIKHLRFTPRMWMPYSEGWAKELLKK